MSLRFCRLAVGFAAWALLGFLARTRGEEAGGLSRAKEEMGRLFPLTLADGRLKLDEEAWKKKPAKAAPAGGKKEGQDEEEDEEAGGLRIIGQGGGQVRINVAAGGGVVLNNAMGLGGLPRPGKIFEEVMQKAGGNFSGGGSSMSGARIELSRTGPNLHGRLTLDRTEGEFQCWFKEQAGDGRFFSFESDKNVGLVIRLTQPATKTSLLFVQAPEGLVALVSSRDKEMTTVAAENFLELLRKETQKVQTLFLRPLAELGLEPPMSPYLPVAMTLACSGFSAPAPEIAQRADALIAKLGAEDMDVREKATQELIELFPQAIQHLMQARDRTEDAEVRARLSKVAGAHPTIAKARPVVEALKLHEDKAYLLNILKTVPLLKAPARARLAQLYGKDYGEDPGAWPAPPEPAKKW